MASESDIKAAIEQIVHNFSNWTIGVTDNPSRRMSEHANPPGWRHWDADTEQEARNVESYFIDKGMKGSFSGLGRADYVYIF